MSSEVFECFLSGLDSTQTLMHRLRIYDSLTNDIDQVFVSDVCYKLICNSSDDEVARMWIAYKQAVSAGYSESSFIFELKRELERRGCRLIALVSCYGEGTHLVAISPPLSAMTGDLRLWCKSRIPMPKKIIDVAEDILEFCHAKSSWEWLGGRWLIATPPMKKGVERAEPPHNGVLFNMAKNQYGDPPDLFAAVCHSETLAGFELIRRLLI